MLRMDRSSEAGQTMQHSSVIGGTVLCADPALLLKESELLVGRLLQRSLEAEPTLNSCKIYLVTGTLLPPADTSPPPTTPQPGPPSSACPDQEK